MHGLKEVIKEAEILPVEERVIIIDSLLQSLNSINQTISENWTNLAKIRLNELRSGSVKGIPGNIVFEKIKTRFS